MTPSMTPTRRPAGELEAQLTDLLQRQRELFLAAPVLPGGRFDPSLHPPRYPWRHALLGALTTALVVALTWCAAAASAQYLHRRRVDSVVNTKPLTCRDLLIHELATAHKASASPGSAGTGTARTPRGCSSAATRRRRCSSRARRSCSSCSRRCGPARAFGARAGCTVSCIPGWHEARNLSLITQHVSYVSGLQSKVHDAALCMHSQQQFHLLCRHVRGCRRL